MCHPLNRLQRTQYSDASASLWLSTRIFSHPLFKIFQCHLTGKHAKTTFRSSYNSNIGWPAGRGLLCPQERDPSSTLYLTSPHLFHASFQLPKWVIKMIGAISQSFFWKASPTSVIGFAQPNGNIFTSLKFSANWKLKILKFKTKPSLGGGAIFLTTWIYNRFNLQPLLYKVSSMFYSINKIRQSFTYLDISLQICHLFSFQHDKWPHSSILFFILD